jgi:hypothetical protein
MLCETKKTIRLKRKKMSSEKTKTNNTKTKTKTKRKRSSPSPSAENIPTPQYREAIRLYNLYIGDVYIFANSQTLLKHDSDEIVNCFANTLIAIGNFQHYVQNGKHSPTVATVDFAFSKKVAAKKLEKIVEECSSLKTRLISNSFAIKHFINDAKNAMHQRKKCEAILNTLPNAPFNGEIVICMRVHGRIKMITEHTPELTRPICKMYTIRSSEAGASSYCNKTNRTVEWVVSKAPALLRASASHFPAVLNSACEAFMRGVTSRFIEEEVGTCKATVNEFEVDDQIVEKNYRFEHRCTAYGQMPQELEIIDSQGNCFGLQFCFYLLDNGILDDKMEGNLITTTMILKQLQSFFKGTKLQKIIWFERSCSPMRKKHCGNQTVEKIMEIREKVNNAHPLKRKSIFNPLEHTFVVQSQNAVYGGKTQKKRKRKGGTTSLNTKRMQIAYIDKHISPMLNRLSDKLYKTKILFTAYNLKELRDILNGDTTYDDLLHKITTICKDIHDFLVEYRQTFSPSISAPAPSLYNEIIVIDDD